MFKKFSYTMAVFCMLCSSALSSLHAECPCRKKPKKPVVKHIMIPDQEQQELAH